MASESSVNKTLLLLRYPVFSAAERIMLDDVLEDAPDLYRLTRKQLESLCGRPFRTDEWTPAVWQEQSRNDELLLNRLSIQILRHGQIAYPAMLRETARPPFALFVRGTLPSADLPALAMVGTRFPTGRGLEAAATLAREAAREGVVVVSGLARGIDAAAHSGAVQGGSPTLAVLGCGIDQVYPKANRRLAAAIIDHGGCLLSEYLPGTNPARWTFPERNRIIAGLSRSTLVVEAPSKSGALITADFALEEGRDVYVAQACIGSVRSQGSDALVDGGAKAVTRFRDIADDWRFAFDSVQESAVGYRTTLNSRRLHNGY